MTTTTHGLLDDVLPQYDIAARYSIRIHAPADTIYGILKSGIPVGNITKILMTLRGLPRIFRRKNADTFQPEEFFYRLKHAENREIVLGIIGQFWKPVACPIKVENLDHFLQFSQDGYCKAAWNMMITEKAPGVCVLSTETRVQTFGTAKRKFKDYWRIVGPFSGIIRREILRKVKHRSETGV